MFEWQLLAGEAADRYYVNGREGSGSINTVFMYNSGTGVTYRYLNSCLNLNEGGWRAVV